MPILKQPGQSPGESDADYNTRTKEWIRRDQREPSYTSYTKSSPRKPSKTPFTKTWPLSKKKGNNNRHHFVFWDFVKHKWQTQEDVDREIRTFIGGVFWLIFWVFSIIFTKVLSIVFIIPAIILSLIGAIVLVKIIQYQVKEAWNKYFPEYQEFKEQSKSKEKNNGEQMATLGELFEGYEVGIDWGDERGDDKSVVNIVIEQKYASGGVVSKDAMRDLANKIRGQ